MTSSRRALHTDLAARAGVCLLFTLLSVNLYREYALTGHATGLLLLASESTVVILTVFRRRALSVDRSLGATLVTAICVVGPPLLRTSNEAGLFPDAVTAGISAIGLMVVVIGKLTLGRSFGLVPANRGVVGAGPYAFVRHPIYSGYVITHVAFLLAHPTAWNASVVAITDTALIVRALVEERILCGDEAYRTYCERVSWHLLPGVF